MAWRQAKRVAGARLLQGGERGVALLQGVVEPVLALRRLDVGQHLSGKKSVEIRPCHLRCTLTNAGLSMA